MSVEGRRKERFSLKLPAQISATEDSGGKALVAETKEISSVGAFFEIDQPIQVGAEVEIELVLSLEKLKQLQGKHARIKISGLVVRADEKGMAVCFDEDYEISPLDK